MENFQDESDPIADFFAKYPQFYYNPDNSPSKEFRRMCHLLRLGTHTRNEARTEFNNAIARKFNAVFGVDEDSLAAWQALCERLQLESVPDSLNECRCIVKATHVNLVDLVDSNETEVLKFDSVAELRRYSVRNHKIFPKENAHAGNLLKYLLRKFF